MSASAYDTAEGFLPLGAGLHLYYKTYDPVRVSGPIPVLCLPGFWRNSRDFSRIAAHLAGVRRVVTPDMRGRGRSSRATDVREYHFDELRGDVWRLLDYLRIERVAIIGTTLGGFMALEMATERPERIAGIVLNDVGTETSSPASKQMAGHVDHEHRTLTEVIGKMKQQHGGFFPEFNASDWERFALDAYREDGAGRYVRDFDAQTHAETARFKQDRPTFWNEFVGLGSLPIAILRGQFSEYMPAALAERMIEANSSATLTTVPGRGHPPLLTETESLAAIQAVLDRADGERAI
jgi:pimeloyl-ACP methyl ester carboxylesterase